MITNKIYTLVRRLFQLTQENKLAWQETAHEGTFQLPLDDLVIRLTEKAGPEPTSPPAYSLLICNAKGTVLEQVHEEDISERVRDAQGFLRDLHQRARRSAMGVEAAIDRAIQQLEDKRNEGR